MAGCKIDESSPVFARLREHYRKNGFPHIEDDLKKAFKAISENIEACKCWRAARVPDVLSGLILYKYRQNSSDLKRGASYGWRIYALYNPKTGIMYPAFIFSKKQYEDCGDDELKEAVRETLKIIGKMPEQKTLPMPK